MSLKNKILSRSNQFKYYKEKTETLKKENKKLKKENKKLKEQNKELNKYEKGISVIIPSYKGENHIIPLLNSLKEQTLSKELYEIIFVINGEFDSTINLLKKFIIENPKMNIILSYTKTPGVCNARNIGIKLANREYTGFVDDDDFISPKYLEKLYQYAKPNQITMSDFIDVNEKTHEKIESKVRPFSENTHGIIKNAPNKFINLAVVTTAKIIPTHAVKTVEFNTKLTSGVDISYYGKLYPKYNFKFYIIDKKEEAIYYRIIRTGSISRQNISFGFNVLDRLKVIDDLNESYEKTTNKKYKKYLKNCIGGQCGFMIRYLNQNPQDKENVLNEIKKHNLSYFPYERLENL